jgi:hypothetical protein
MSTGDVLAIVAATVVTLLVGALAVVLIALTRTLQQLRHTVDALRAEAIPLLNDARDAVRDAGKEVDRVERLVTSAERVGDAKRALATPVVKAMAFGTGVSRGARRLREGDTKPRRRSAS